LSVLGYRNEGGTLDTPGMLMVNGCSWAHIIQLVGGIAEIPQDSLLTGEEIDALNGKRSPQGLLGPAPEGTA